MPIIYEVTSPDPITIGSSAINFALESDANISYPITTAEIAAGLTSNDITDNYPPGNVLRYGANTTPGTTDMTTAIQDAIDVMDANAGGCVVLPQGDYKITATIDMKVKDHVYMCGESRARLVMHTDNTPIMEFGSNSSTMAVQQGGLENIYFIYNTDQTILQTAGIGLKLYSCAACQFKNLWFDGVHSAIQQATDTGTNTVNVVFENLFDQIYIYDFTGNGIKLAAINSGGTPNNWGKVYINGGGNEVLNAIHFTAQADHFDALNIENMTATEEALIYLTTGTSSVTIDHLHMEGAVADSTCRGMIHVRSNSLTIGNWTIHNTEFDNAVVPTTYILSYSFGTIDVETFKLNEATLTGGAVLQLLRAYDGTPGAAYRVRIGTLQDLSGSIGSYGDITSEYIDRCWIDTQNSPDTLDVLTTADATPTVRGVGRCTITNASPQTITNFDNGYAGQVVKIRALDGNTTFEHAASGAGLRMFGGSDATLTNGQAIEFVNFGSDIWVETQRSFQAQYPYSVTNVVTDRTYDADSTTTAELADILGTLIADLQARGIVQ